MLTQQCISFAQNFSQARASSPFLPLFLIHRVFSIPSRPWEVPIHLNSCINTDTSYYLTLLVSYTLSDSASNHHCSLCQYVHKAVLPSLTWIKSEVSCSECDSLSKPHDTSLLKTFLWLLSSLGPSTGNVLYEIHFEITGYPCNVIGSQPCDLFTNRTIFCSKSYLFLSQ